MVYRSVIGHITDLFKRCKHSLTAFLTLTLLICTLHVILKYTAIHDEIQKTDGRCLVSSCVFHSKRYRL